MAYESHNRMTRVLSVKLAKTEAPKSAANDPSAKFLQVLALFDQTGHWPSIDDPLHGKTMKMLNERFAKRDFKGNAFTFDIYEMFKRRNYALPVPKRLKAIEVALDTLSKGHQLTRQVANDVRGLYVDGKISKDDIAELQNLKFCF